MDGTKVKNYIQGRCDNELNISLVFNFLHLLLIILRIRDPKLNHFFIKERQKQLQRKLTARQGRAIQIQMKSKDESLDVTGISGSDLFGC